MKKILSILLTGVFILGGAFTAYAATTTNTVTAQLRPDFEIVIDQKECGFKNADNRYVYPVVYDGTTYLPLRAVAGIMGKSVNWNESTKTVTLSGSGKSQISNPSNTTNLSKETIKVELRTDFTIIIDDAKHVFKDANGKTTYPILYNGSTYLPIRAIGEVMGKTVTWDNANKIVTLSGGSLTVTDADSFNTTNGGTNTTPTTPNSNKKYISESAVRKIILAKVPGASASDIYMELDYDDGRVSYEGDLFYNGYEYEFDIDAVSGDVIGWDVEKMDYDDYQKGNSTPAKSNSSKSYLSEAAVHKIVLAKVSGASASDIYMELDYDDGRVSYEGHLVYKGYEYEFDIDAVSGKIIDWDVERMDYDD